MLTRAASNLTLFAQLFGYPLRTKGLHILGLHDMYCQMPTTRVGKDPFFATLLDDTLCGEGLFIDPSSFLVKNTFKKPSAMCFTVSGFI